MDDILHQLVSRYRELQRMGEGQRQARGQQFNAFLAEVLSAWGVEAYADQRGIGGRDETDVAFSLGHTYYILEAKWEAHPVNVDPLAKLQLRLKFRPPGVVGVLVSMSGFTKHVYDFAASHPEILLWDHTHVEAMVCGLLNPAELMHQLMSYASRRGGGYVSLSTMALSHVQPTLESWTKPDAATAETHGSFDIVDGVSAKPLFTSPYYVHPNGFIMDGEGTALFTSKSGVHSLDLASGTARCLLPLEGCRKSVQRKKDGTLLALRGPHSDGHTQTKRGYSVVSWCSDASSLELAAGGLSSSTNILKSKEGESWLISTVEEKGGYRRQKTYLKELGGTLADGDEYPISEESWTGERYATFTESGHIYMTRGHHQTVIDMTTFGNSWVAIPEGLWAGPIAPLRDDLIIGIFCDDRPVRSYLYIVDVGTGSFRRIASIGHCRVDSINLINRQKVLLMIDENRTRKTILSVSFPQVY
ncbi:restriction endonuclease [Streptomyces niveus]|uniref:restriction endonuclease n=1 Tax=Streptomyces niveus TaxID=193462 RepID=UPI0034445633